MRIALVNLTSGGLSGGYRKYLRHVLPVLRADARVRELAIWSPAVALDAEWRAQGHRSWPAADARRLYRGLRGEIREFAPDVVFVPTARWLDFGDVPTVVMVRNMEPLVRPLAGNGVAEACVNLVRRGVAWSSVRRADRVVAVSHHVREFLERTWKVPPERIEVVPHGADLEPGLEARRPEAVRPGEEGAFLFTAGSVRPARGLEDAIGALARLTGPAAHLPLIIAGDVDGRAGRYRARMQALAGALGVGERVRWAGRLSPAEMGWCMLHCAAFLMTSRVEACPNTALEALAWGAPVASGAHAPMPEFFGPCALYYASGDAPSLARATEGLLAEAAPARAARRAASLRRAGSFTWRRTGCATVDLLERACRG